MQAQQSLRDKPPEWPAAEITVLCSASCPRSLGFFTWESSEDLFLTVQIKESKAIQNQEQVCIKEAWTKVETKSDGVCMKCSLQAHVFEHLIPNWLYYFEGSRDLWDTGPIWWKWVAGGIP